MTFLDEIVSSTRKRIAEYRQRFTSDVLEQRVASAPPARPFPAVLAGGDFSIIAEIKRATPSAGVLAEDLNPADLAAAYAAGGAAAISVLTEPDFFLGSLDDLAATLEAGPPVLRKDFVLDPWQLLESRAAGADAVLLIVRLIGGELHTFLRGAEALGLHTLVEVFDEDDLRVALDANVRVIGINSRDLETFEIDPGRATRMLSQIPEEVVVIALSGVSTRAEVKELESAGMHGALVGEALVTSPDPATKLRELRGEA